jgi:hypothetical protein
MRLTASRWVVVITGTILVLAVVSIVGVAFRPGRVTAVGMPEAALQAFFDAIAAGDAALARSTMTDRLAAVCTTDRLRYPMNQIGDRRSSHRIEVTETRQLSDGRFRFGIRITSVTVSPPFSVSEWDRVANAELVEEAGSWRLDSIWGGPFGCQ